MTVKNVAMNKKVRAAIYIRVSTEEQHLNGLSLPAQKQALTEYALKNEYEITQMKEYPPANQCAFEKNCRGF